MSGSVDIGPFPVNTGWNPPGTVPNGAAVYGTNRTGRQKFNGNPDANITLGISILEGKCAQFGNDAAGRYVGDPGLGSNGSPINQNACGA